MSDIASIVARRKPRRDSVRLLLDGELEGRIGQQRDKIKRAQIQEKVNGSSLASPTAQLEAELSQLMVEADEASTEFVFQAIPRADYAELERRFPATEEEWEKYRETVKDLPILLAMQVSIPDVDLVGMGPALLAACAVNPKMTADEAQLLWDTLSDAEAAALFNTAYGVNKKAANRPFSGTDTATTPNFGPELTTPLTEESPSLSLAEGS